MTITVDGKALNVEELEVEVVPAGTESDDWESGAYKRRLTLFGGYLRWRLEAFEEDSVAWSSSAFKDLQDKAKAGGSVALAVSTPTYSYTGSVNVVGIQVRLRAEARSASITLQEVM